MSPNSSETSLEAPSEARSLAGSDTDDCSIQLSVYGNWVKVPALHVEGATIIATGRWLRRAVIHDEEWLQADLQDAERCVRTLKSKNSRTLGADFFTFTQKPPANEPRYAFHVEPESIAIASTSNFAAWWEGLPQETRKNVRRSAKRGVVLSVRQLDDDLVSGIMEINNESPLIQGRKSRCYGKSHAEVWRDHSSFPDRSDFICAHHENELVGFLKLVYRGEVASILGFLSKVKHSDKRPANALIAKAFEICESKGISYLTYGQFNYGNKRDSPLREFKIRNGFSEILIPRYYVPLTAWGKVGMGLGLHRGLLGVLPPRVIAMGLNARGKWFEVRTKISRCSLKEERPNSNRQMGRSTPPAGSNI
jgi:hypothetical protein